DILHTNGAARSLRVRSMVGLIPLFAVETLEPEVVEKLHGFKRRMQWFIDNHPEFRDHVQMVAKPGVGSRRLLSIVSREQLPRVLCYLLDEAEFLSPHGICAVSRFLLEHPYVLRLGGHEYRDDCYPDDY